MHNKIDIDLEIAHLPVDLVTGIASVLRYKSNQ